MEMPSVGRFLRALILQLCAWTAGLGLAMLPFPFFQWWSGFSVSALEIHAAAIVAALAYIVLRWRFSARVVARVACGTAGLLLFVTGLLNWEGHAGGYWQANRVKSLLHDVMYAQEKFRDSTGRFAAGIPGSVTVAPKVVDLQLRLTPDGWTASARHEDLDGVCAVYVGSTPLPPATVPERPWCEPTGLREQDLVVPLLLAVGGLLLGTWLERRTSSATSPNRPMADLP